MHIKKGKKGFLTVVLSLGLLSTLTLPPSLANGNNPPTADFHWSPVDDIQTNEIINFFDDSYDTDGNIIAWQWDFDDGEYSIIQNPTHSYSDTGAYDVTLKVIDNNGSTDTQTYRLTIINAPPTADAGPDQIVNNTLVSFDGTGSSDPDGTIVSYLWDFGDGITGTGATVQHNYSTDDEYTVTLNITDNGGAHDEDTAEITVDTVKPKTNITLDGTKGEGDWYNSNVSILLLRSDATSGIDKTYYMINQSSWKTYTSSFIISNEGVHTLKYYSVDKAGNVEATNTRTIKIDKTAPSVTFIKPEEGYLHYFGRAIVPTIRNKTIIAGGIKVEANVTSAPSEVQNVVFYVDENRRHNTSEPPYIWRWGLAFGRHTLKVTAFDEAGYNASKEMEVTIFSILPRINPDQQQYMSKEE